MFLDGVKSRKKSLVIPSQIKAIEKEIEEAQGEVNEWEKKKQDLLHDTCETYTDKKVNDFGMWVLFYKNRDLDKRFYTWQEFYEIDKPQVMELFTIFARATQKINVENLKYIALAPFFSNYYNLLGNMGHTFFGDKPVYKLSFNQITLLSYAKVFKNIFENISDIPDEVRNRPDALLQFAESNKKAEKFRSRAASKDGYSVVGATQRDMKRMGLGKGEDTIDISTLAKQKGKDGRLTAQDFL